MDVPGMLAALGGPLGNGARTVVGSLLELVYPETCVLCGVQKGERSWCVSGARLAGLMWYDGPHLCWECGRQLQPSVIRGSLPAGGVPVYAGMRTGPELVAVLSQWKYHGVRGLAWPLTALLQSAVVAASQATPVDYLVPVALHGRRRRVRGFNQASVIAHLVAEQRLMAGVSAPAIRTDVLRRVRSTGQQAKLNDQLARQMNLAGAFKAKEAPDRGVQSSVGLIDDLVTGGATCEAATGALQAAGWNVSWVAALGLAGGSDGPVDSGPSEF